jgi:hypothetical protein
VKAAVVTVLATVLIGCDTDSASKAGKESISAFAALGGGRFVGDYIPASSERRTIGIHAPNSKVTDADLVHLKGLPDTEYLNFENTKITDAGLVHLSGLTHLAYLTFHSTKITDDGLVHVGG